MQSQSLESSKFTSQKIEKSKFFRVGWGLILALSAMSIANSTYLAFFDNQWIDGHIAWLSASVYAFVVFITGYRRQERWAWYVTWAFGIPFLIYGMNHLDEAMLGPFYVAASLVVAFAQLLTWSAFHRDKDQS